jgi:hypothetical protein
MLKLSRGIVAVGMVAALVFGSSPATAAQMLPLSLCSPTENTFDLQIDNPYFPLLPGQQSVFFGFDDGEPLGLRITVLKKTETFYETGTPIVTRVVEELEWADENENGKVDKGEERIEVSRNYFAQTDSDTVCYFGEEVKIYEDGRFRGDTTGSWRADTSGNAPGIFMPADPTKGLKWQMEVAPAARDTAEIKDDGVTIEVPQDEYTDAIEVEDCNPIDGDCGTKYYAPGTGLIVDGDVQLTKFVAGR